MHSRCGASPRCVKIAVSDAGPETEIRALPPGTALAVATFRTPGESTSISSVATELVPHTPWLVTVSVYEPEAE